MFKLLNRFAWIISLIAGIIISNYIISTSYYFRISGLWIIFWLILWLIFKRLFLSKNYIEKRVTFFANAISDNPIVWVSENKEKLKEKEKRYNVEENDSYLSLQEESNSLDADKSFLSLDSDLWENEVDNREKIDYKASIIKEEEKEPKIVEPTAVDILFENLSKWIKSFFSENILAKIWWILIFLCALFFLKLGFEWVWDFWKIMIWAFVWFTTYWVWVWLDKKWLQNQAIVLLWIGILINFLVILSWRYLLWDINSPYLSSWVTFFFLILNTVFAVLTSFIYSSRTLLIFWFLCSFINPLFFLEDISTYSIVWYSLIVSLWWLFLGFKKSDLILSVWVFILWNLLFLVAPFTSDIEWITKLVASAIIWVWTIFVVYKNKPELLPIIYPINFIFIIMTLLWWWTDILTGNTSFISYMWVIVLFFWIGMYYLLSISSILLYQIFIFPVLIVLGLTFTWGTNFVPFIPVSLALITLIYIWSFSLIQNSLSSFFKYFFFLVLWVFILSSNTYVWIATNSYFSGGAWLLSNAQFITMILVSFVFLIFLYYISRKKGSEYSYSVWTLLSIFMFLPVLKVWNKCTDLNLNCITNDNTQVTVSIISVIVFSLLNWILPFINKNLTHENANFKNLLFWSVLGILFIGFQLFNYWNEYFPWVETWLAFMILAIVYFVLSFLMIQKIWLNVIKSAEVSDSSKKNTVLSYLWISISLFSFAIALVFSDVKEIVSTVWLFEATILFYFYSRTKEKKIYIVAIILFALWVLDMFSLIDVVKRNDFWFLVPFSIIFTFFVYNLVSLKKFHDKKNSLMNAHDILHIIWILVLWMLLAIIIPNTNHWGGLLWIWLFITVISWVYSYFNSWLLKRFLVLALIIFYFTHIAGSEIIMSRLDSDNLEHLRILQYLTTLLLWIAVYIWNKLSKEKKLNTPVNITYSIYLLVITSIYIFDIFNSTFAVTMYWWILSAIFIFHWLQSNLIKFRTIWLYLLSLTAVKIFFYDIWNWFDNAISRVAALLVIWILFIVISIAYSKKLWSNLKWEFKLSNFSDKESEEEKIKEQTEEVKQYSKNHESTNTNDKNKKTIINEKIKDIDASEYSWIKFILNTGEKVQIRAVNLIKIVKGLTNDFEKTSFEKWELAEKYDYVIKHYKSDLSKANYDKIVEILKKFVEEWWNVKPIKKK